MLGDIFNVGLDGVGVLDLPAPFFFRLDGAGNVLFGSTRYVEVQRLASATSASLTVRSCGLRSSIDMVFLRRSMNLARPAFAENGPVSPCSARHRLPARKESRAYVPATIRPARP